MKQLLLILGVALLLTGCIVTTSGHGGWNYSNNERNWSYGHRQHHFSTFSNREYRRGPHRGYGKGSYRDFKKSRYKNKRGRH